MEKQEIYERLNSIFSVVLKHPDISLSPSSSANDVNGWTSLTHMILIDEIESTFKIKFKLNEILKFNNVGDMVACIEKKLG